MIKFMVIFLLIANLFWMMERTVVGQFVRKVSEPKISSGKSQSDFCFCQLDGTTVEECSCSVTSVDSFNNNRMFPLISGLVRKDYFRYFKINLKRQCPFWPADWACSTPYCAVDQCTDVPDGLKFRQIVQNNTETVEDVKEVVRGVCDENTVDPLNSELSNDIRKRSAKWSQFDDAIENQFCSVDEIEADADSEAQFVDLLANTERHTGFYGFSAQRIWRSIYEENCFRPDPRFEPRFLLQPNLSGLCLEKRVFYRLISGLHSSISIHISSKFYRPAPFGMGPGSWSYNFNEFGRRFDPSLTRGQSADWLRNLYFLYLFEMRAIQKIGPYLRSEPFYTGSEKGDRETSEMANNVLNTIDSFDNHFNETKLFQYPSSLARSLKAEFREHFQNVSRILDCVGCDKCRLWGKLQIAGVGTSLRILLSDKISPAKFQLQRTELVSLLNAFKQLSESIQAVDMFRQHLAAAIGNEHAQQRTFTIDVLNQ